MRKLLAVVLLAAAVACGALWFTQNKQQGGPTAGGGTNAGAGAGAGAAGVTGADGNDGAPQEQVLPVEKARLASPIYEPHASWPKLESLPAFPEKPSKELEILAAEVEYDTTQWLSKDLRFTRGVDGRQVYLKGVNATSSVTVLVARNRASSAGLYTLAFEASFADAVPVDAANAVKRLKVVLGPELFTEVEKRGFKVSPAITGTEDFAGFVTFGDSGPGQVFPYLHCYAKAKQVVGILQTIAMKKVK